jgi:DNA-binding MarR family transcriptional regulator
MKKADARTANLFGALALVTMDSVHREMDALTDICESDCAALVVLGQSPGITVDRLAKILRLSQPGTVRLVDRLEKEGRVERRQGTDRRARPLALTPAGERTVKAVLLGREKVLLHALGALSEQERQTLSGLMEKMLQGIARENDEIASDTACRLCDEQACPEDRCPLTPGCKKAA